jgi:hypothetical protein
MMSRQFRAKRLLGRVMPCRQDGERGYALPWLRGFETLALNGDSGHRAGWDGGALVAVDWIRFKMRIAAVRTPNFASAVNFRKAGIAVAALAPKIARPSIADKRTEI